MKLILQFDCDADIIDVPEHVVLNRELYRKQFLKWIYNPKSIHGYRVINKGFSGVRYRGDAFVQWLNKRIIKKASEKATLEAQYVKNIACDIPTIFL